jgi:hypothetical protein
MEFGRQALISAARAAVVLTVVGCTQQSALVQERAHVRSAFTDTAWYRAHCVVTDTLRPDFTACLLRDQSAVRGRPGDTIGPQGTILRRP